MSGALRSPEVASPGGVAALRVARAACVAATLLLATADAHAAPAVPLRVEMELVVEARGMTVGEGRDVFETDGKRYSVVTDARTVGLARLLKKVDEHRESQGVVTDKGLRPLSFRQQRTGKAPNSASFDWSKGELTMIEGDEVEKVPLVPMTFDQTSLPYAFVFGEPPKAERISVRVTDGRKLQEYDLALVGRERIITELGQLDTLRYRKIQPPDDKRGFEFWLGLDHHRLPVRIRIIEKDGTAFDSTVTRITYPARP
jgi:hypothetical protein